MVSGCSLTRTTRETPEVITKEEVISLLHSGRVRGVFQPHFGHVSIDLKDGTTKWYDQEKLDWIIEYIYRHNLQGELEYVAME
jgi:hypothetical protein